MKRTLLVIALLAFACKKDAVPRTTVFGVGGTVGPALRSFAGVLPSEVQPPTSFYDTLKYESAFFKILVDGQESKDATVKVGDVTLNYDEGHGLYTPLDENGLPRRLNLSAGTQITINTPKYDETITFTLPEITPPSQIDVQDDNTPPTFTRSDSIVITWSGASGGDSIQVFFKLGDKDPYIENLPPNETRHVIPPSVLDTTGSALLMVGVLKYLDIEGALPPSRMLIIKSSSYPSPIQVE